jgi:hypothetical protein
MNFGYNIVVMILAYILTKLENKNWLILIKLMPLITVLALNHWRDGWNTETWYGFLAMINYDMIFMSAGMIDNFFWEEQKTFLINTFFKSNFAPFTMIVGCLIISMTIPAVNVNMGDIFNYPLYAFTWLQDGYSFGSFFWIYFWTYYAEQFNSKFNEKTYIFFNGASMWMYITHYIYIVISCKFFILPYNLSLL